MNERPTEPYAAVVECGLSPAAAIMLRVTDKSARPDLLSPIRADLVSQWNFVDAVGCHDPI